MKVTWGTHPNHIGHMSYPGCFRCHDGDHAAKDGTSITQTVLPATTSSLWTNPNPRSSPTSASNNPPPHRT